MSVTTQVSNAVLTGEALRKADIYLMCHGEDHKVIGPAFSTDVAKNTRAIRLTWQHKLHKVKVGGVDVG